MQKFDLKKGESAPNEIWSKFERFESRVSSIDVLCEIFIYMTVFGVSIVYYNNVYD